MPSADRKVFCLRLVPETTTVRHVDTTRSVPLPYPLTTRSSVTAHRVRGVVVATVASFTLPATRTRLIYLARRGVLPAIVDGRQAGQVERRHSAAGTPESGGNEPQDDRRGRRHVSGEVVDEDSRETRRGFAGGKIRLNDDGKKKNK